jgi:hypothetical protein
MLGSQTVHSILDEAAAAVGGWAALQSIRSVHLDSEGQDWEPWQAYDIGGTVDVSTFRIVTDLDLGAGASRVEMDAEVVYPWPHRVAYIEISDAEAGMLADLSLGAVAITRLLCRRQAARRHRRRFDDVSWFARPMRGRCTHKPPSGARATPCWHSRRSRAPTSAARGRRLAIGPGRRCNRARRARRLRAPSS